MELIQACLRVCFEKVLSELLRRSAEAALSDMIQILFARLDTLATTDEDAPVTTLVIRPADAPQSTQGEQVLEGVPLWRG